MDLGTHKSAYEDVLRIYDFRMGQPDDGTEHRMIRAEVSHYVEDPERLRKMLEENAAEESTSDLQSN